jgi:membrane protein
MTAGDDALTTHRNKGPQTGRTADSPLQMPLAGWKQVAARTWKQSSEDNVALVAAGVAFYGFLALVPLLGAVVLTYGIIAEPQTVVSNIKSLTTLMPQDAAKLIGQQLMSVVQTSGSKKGAGLLIAIAVALFGARNAAGSIITALNIAYEEEEKRGFLRVNLLSLVITAGAVLLSVAALVAIAALGYLEKLFPHLPGFAATIGKIVSYAILVLGGAAAAATLYRYGPDRRKARWEWITPGSIFSALAWLILTVGFGFYVAHFGNYNKTYGSLATIVILVTWMYLSAYVFLFGAELNSELEHQTAKDTTEGAPKPVGDRGAWSANHVAGSDEPSKAGGRAETLGKEEEAGGKPAPSRQARDLGPKHSAVDDYVAGRIANRAGAIAGMRSVGMVSAILSTVGLALLRKRGKGAAGVTLVAAAAGLSLLRRSD